MPSGSCTPGRGRPGCCASALLSRSAATGAVLGVALSAALATVGPQMLDLLPRSSSLVFAPVLALALLLLLAVRQAERVAR